MQLIQGTEDRHNAAKYQAEDKPVTIGALDRVEGPPSKAVARTHLKRSERLLRGTISGAIANTSRLASQPMTQAQYHEATTLVKKLPTQIREEYRDIISKLDFAILSEEQASKEDTILLWTTKEFLVWPLPEVSSIRAKMVENMANKKELGQAAVQVNLKT